jgi:hypothetical protein
MELTQIEQLNVTYALSYSLAEWEKSSEHPFFSLIGSRVVGVIATPITGLIDAVAHVIIAGMKFVTGVFISPYNFLARCFGVNEKYIAPADLELSSACTHLFLAFKSLVFIPIVSVTAAFSPDLASENADSRIIFRSRPKPFVLSSDFYMV